MKYNQILLIAATLALTGCSDPVPPPAPAPQPQAQVLQAAPAQPVIVQQDSSTGDLLTGAALGALAANAMSSRAPTQPVAVREVHTRTVVVKQVPRPAPAPVRLAPRPTVRLEKARPSYASKSVKVTKVTYRARK